MSDEKRTNRLLVGIAVVLVIAVAFLGYSVYALSHRLDQVLKEQKASLVAPESVQSQPPAQEPPRVAQPAPSLPPLSPEPSLPSPFDPGTWDPFREMAEMQERMEQLFNDAFHRFHMSPRFGDLAKDIGFNPKFDMSEDDTKYTIRLDIPGADTANLQIKLDDRTLTISGKREKEAEEQLPGRAIRQERRIGQFQRTITLPGPVKQGSLKSEYKDGVLTITIEKDKS